MKGSFEDRNILKNDFMKVYIIHWANRRILFVGERSEEIKRTLSNIRDLSREEKKTLRKEFGDVSENMIKACSGLPSANITFVYKTYIFDENNIQRVIDKIRLEIPNIVKGQYISSKGIYAWGYYKSTDGSKHPVCLTHNFLKDRKILQIDPSQIVGPKRLDDLNKIKDTARSLFFNPDGIRKANIQGSTNDLYMLNQFNINGEIHIVTINDVKSMIPRGSMEDMIPVIFNYFPMIEEESYESLDRIVWKSDSNEWMPKETIEDLSKEYNLLKNFASIEKMNERDRLIKSDKKFRIVSFSLQKSTKTIFSQIRHIFETYPLSDRVPFIKHRGLMEEDIDIRYYDKLLDMKNGSKLIEMFSRNKIRINKTLGIISDVTTKNTLSFKLNIGKRLSDKPDDYITISIRENGNIFIKYLSSAQMDYKAHEIPNMIRSINDWIQGVQGMYGIAKSKIEGIDIKNIEGSWKTAWTTDKVNGFAVSEKIQVPTGFRRNFIKYIKKNEPFVRLNVDRQHTLSYTYKKTSNYQNISNVEGFISTKVQEDRSLAIGYIQTMVIKAIMTEFQVTEDLARKYVNYYYSKAEERRRNNIPVSYGITIQFDEVDITDSSDSKSFIVTYSGFSNFIELHRCVLFNHLFLEEYFSSLDLKIKQAEMDAESIHKEVIKSSEEESVPAIPDIRIEKLPADDEGLSEIDDDDGFGVDIDEDAELFEGQIEEASQRNSQGSNAAAAGPSKLPEEKFEAKDLEKMDISGKSQYLLRRLKQHDIDVFGYKGEKHDYSRLCLASEGRQPLALSDSEFKKLKKKPSDDELMKYRSIYYTCPEAWCSRCEQAYMISDLKKVESNNQDITHAECPVCGGEYDIKNKDDSVLLIPRKFKTGHHKFPGFLKKAKTPGNLCLPCCFKKKQKPSDECDEKPAKESKNSEKKNSRQDANAAEEDEEDIDDESIINKYILGSEKFPLPEYRFGELPSLINGLFNPVYKQKGYIERGYYGYLRYGLPMNDFRGIFELYGNGYDKMIDLITTKNIGKIGNGRILDMFYDKSVENTVNNIKSYLRSTKNVHTKVLTALLAEPGFATKIGMNAVILNLPESGDYTSLIDIECSTIDNTIPTIFLIRRRYHFIDNYEAIVFVSELNNSIRIQKDFTSTSGIVQTVILKMLEKCNKSLDHMLSAIDTYNGLKKLKMTVVAQFIVKNKVEYLITKNVVIPCIPSEPIASSSIKKIYTLRKNLHSLSNTMERLNMISNSPDFGNGYDIAEYYSSQGNIVGLKIKNGGIVPVKPILRTEIKEIEDRVRAPVIEIPFDVEKIDSLQKETEESGWDQRMFYIWKNRVKDSVSIQLKKYISKQCGGNEMIRNELKEAISNKNTESIKRILHRMIQGYVKSGKASIPEIESVSKKLTDMLNYYLVQNIDLFVEIIYNDLMNKGYEKDVILSGEYTIPKKYNSKKSDIISIEELKDILGSSMDRTKYFLKKQFTQKRKVGELNPGNLTKLFAEEKKVSEEIQLNTYSHKNVKEIPSSQSSESNTNNSISIKTASPEKAAKSPAKNFEKSDLLVYIPMGSLSRKLSSKCQSVENNYIRAIEILLGFNLKEVLLLKIGKDWRDYIISSNILRYKAKIDNIEDFRKYILNPSFLLTLNDFKLIMDQMPKLQFVFCNKRRMEGDTLIVDFHRNKNADTFIVLLTDKKLNHILLSCNNRTIYTVDELPKKMKDWWSTGKLA